MYSIIDIESNGGAYREEVIIDIAIFQFDGHQITDQFMSLVNPEAEITPFVQKLTKITPKMVKTAPKFHEIAKRIVEITQGTTLVGHNVEFDYRMLRQSFRRLGYDFKIDTLDTIPLAKKLIPNAPSYSLGNLVETLGIPLVDRHRAGGDARATLELFKILLNKDTQSEIIQNQWEETNAKTYINKVKEITQDLPNERGILYLQNARGEILYTDFVQDMNKVAKNIFNSKSKRWAKIQEETTQSHYEFSGNSLLAKLMMKTKGITKKENLPFGLYYRNQKYMVEKTSLTKETPLLRFTSYTQGTKALRFINKKEEYQEVENLKALLSLSNKDGLWSTNGRTLGERAFVIIQNKKITDYGFYDYYHQIESLSKVDNLKIPIIDNSLSIKNELALSFLKGDLRKEKNVYIRSQK